MLEGLVVYMAVHFGPGTVEARPFILLRDGSQCELFTPICQVRAEVDYGTEKIAELQKQILDQTRTAYEQAKIGKETTENK